MKIPSLKVRVVVGVGALLLAAGSAHAQTRTWRLPQNGIFSNAAMWVNSIPPASHESAAFGLTSSTVPFTVTFTGNATLGGLQVNNQRPTFNLGGNELQLNGDLFVRGTNTPSLTLLSGAVRRNGPSTIVGDTPGQNGRLVVGAGALLETRHLIAGTNSATGTVIVEGGGVINADHDVWIGRGAGAAGSLTVRGTGSEFNVWNLFTSENAQGSILIDEGGLLTTIHSPGVSWQNSRLDWTIRGAGSRVEIGGTYSAADARELVIDIENGGVWQNQHWMETSSNPLSESVIMIDGAGSEMNTLNGGITFRSGTNDLTITNGGSAAFAHGFRMGCCNFPGQHSVLVRGEGSELVVGDWPNQSGSLFVGPDFTGSAEMIVDQGATLRVEDHTYLGHRGPGRLIVDGPGTLMTSPHTLHVGWHDANSDGELIVRDGAAVMVGHFWMKGGSGSVATATVTDGGLLSSAPHWVSIGEVATLTLSNGGALETTGGIGIGGSTTRAGEVVVDEGSYAFASGRIDLGGATPDNLGILTMTGGTVYSNDYMPILNGGHLRGVGFIETGVGVAGGRVSPGMPVGELFIRNLGVHAHATGKVGTIAIDLGGTTPGVTHDKITIEQGLQITRGVLALSTVEGYTPQVGHTFDIITTGHGVSGQFESVTGADAGDGKAYVVQYLPDRVRVVVDGVTGLEIAQGSLAVAQGFRAAGLSASATYVTSPMQNVTASVEWTSDDPTVATVDAAGVVTGQGEGTTLIRGRYAGFENTVLVDVRSLPKLSGSVPGLIGTLRDPLLLDLDRLTPFMTGAQADSFFSGDEIRNLTGRDNYVGVKLEGRLIAPQSGEYTFRLVSDTSGRVVINGKPVVQHRRYSPEIGPLTLYLEAGEHDIRIDILQYELAPFTLHARWSGPGVTLRTIESSDLIGGSFAASYYDFTPYAFADEVPDLDAFAAAVETIDPQIDYPLFPGGYFGGRMMRFEGNIALPDDAAYTFTLNVDDGAKVWIDDELVMNVWSSWNFGMPHTATVSLPSGVYPIRVDYTEHRGHFAGIVLSIESAGIVRQPVPALAFTHGGDANTCPADFNQDGGVDGADVDAFFMAWEAGESAADVNLDGGVDGADVDTFFMAWEAGGCD